MNGILMKLEPTMILAILAIVQVCNAMWIGYEYRHKKWLWMGVWCFFTGAFTTAMIENICKILGN